MLIDDFTKIECPFVRKIYEINHNDWRRYGAKLGLREPHVYLITPNVADGYQWVLDHKDTIALEKLHGTNIGLVTENNKLIHIQNRKNVVDPFQINGGRAYIMEGVFGAVGKGYIAKDGIQYGECLGPKINCNIYGLPMHLWYPFSKARDSLKYSSFHKHDRGFWTWIDWFRLYLKSLFFCRYHKIPLSDMFTNNSVPFAEGVVFYNDEVSICPGKPRMAKLRRDMMYWYYSDKIEIYGLEDEVIEHSRKNGISLKGY